MRTAVSNRNRTRPQVEPLEDRTLLSLPPGSLDPTFGSAGEVVSSPSPLGFSYLTSIALQPNGDIVAEGTIVDPGASHRDIVVLRYHPDGTRDAGFGTRAKAVIDFQYEDSARRLYVMPDGKIESVSFSADFRPTDNPTISLFRLNPDGSLDTTFGGGDGKASTSIPGYKAFGNVVQADGKMVVACEGATSFALFRFDTDGNLDNSYGSGGELVVPIDSIGTFPNPLVNDGAIVILSDQSVVVAGNATDSNHNNLVPVAHVTAEGALEKLTTVPTGRLHDVGNQMAVAPDDQIYLAGERVFPLRNALGGAIVRLNPDLTLDRSFSTYREFLHDGIGPIVVQSDGKVVGVAKRNLKDLEVFRLETNGRHDLSFGDHGVVSTTFPQGPVYPTQMLVQNDGKILWGGVVTRNGYKIRFALARYIGQPGGAASAGLPTTGPTSSVVMPAPAAVADPATVLAAVLADEWDGPTSPETSSEDPVVLTTTAPAARLAILDALLAAWEDAQLV